MLRYGEAALIFLRILLSLDPRTTSQSKYYLRIEVSWLSVSWEAEVVTVFVSRCYNLAGHDTSFYCLQGMTSDLLCKGFVAKAVLTSQPLPNIIAWSFSRQTSTLFLESVPGNTNTFMFLELNFMKTSQRGQ